MRNTVGNVDERAVKLLEGEESKEDSDEEMKEEPKLNVNLSALPQVRRREQRAALNGQVIESKELEVLGATLKDVYEIFKEEWERPFGARE